MAEQPSGGVERAAPPAGDLRGRVLRGSAWSIGSYATREGMRLVGNVLLARLLFPEAFGLMALVNTIRMGLVMVSDVGLAPSIVRSPRGDEPVFLDTAWTLQLGRGVLLFLLASAAAPFMADFYGAPELALLLPVSAFSLILDAADSMSLMGMRRHLNLRALEKIEIASQAIGLAVMVGWVLVVPTVWALVFGGWASSLARLAMSHLSAGRRDRFAWSRDAARELLGFGSWILLSTLLTFVADQADRLLLGRLVPLSTLGVYSIAAMFAAMPAMLASRLGNFIVFPALSRTLDAGPAALARAFRRTQVPVRALGGLAVAAGFAAAPDAVRVLYDTRYVEAGWMIQVLVAGAWWRMLTIPKGSVLLALGEGRAVAIGHGAKGLGIVAAVPAGYLLGGLPGAIAGFAVSDLVRYAVTAWLVRRHRLPGVGADVLAGLGVAAAATGGALAAQLLPAPPVAKALVGALAAAALWSPAVLRAARAEGWIGARR